jgi:hypothetical protein
MSSGSEQLMGNMSSVSTFSSQSASITRRKDLTTISSQSPASREGGNSSGNLESRKSIRLQDVNSVQDRGDDMYVYGSGPDLSDTEHQQNGKEKILKKIRACVSREDAQD